MDQRCPPKSNLFCPKLTSLCISHRSLKRRMSVSWVIRGDGSSHENQQCGWWKLFQTNRQWRASQSSMLRDRSAQKHWLAVTSTAWRKWIAKKEPIKQSSCLKHNAGGGGEGTGDGLTAFNWNLEIWPSSHPSVPSLRHDTEKVIHPLHARFLICKIRPCHPKFPCCF